MTLENYIKEKITKNGPISLAEFITLAMSHPDYGYYITQEPFGISGDFTTAPEISQMFGELLGIWCVDIWKKMHSPNDIEIIEIGPGRGTLMDDILRATKHIKGFHDSISISMVETSERLTGIQQHKLNHKHPRIKWLRDIAASPPKPLIVIANELFDALPVHQYINHNNIWYERMVGTNKNGDLEIVLQESKEQWQNSYIEQFNFTPPTQNTGAILERCPQAVALIETISDLIKKYGGAALFIDYGYILPEYKNTIYALSHHKHHEILSNIGKVDISAHVNFGLLSKVAQNCSMAVYGAITQGEFLMNMGIETRVKKLFENATEEQKSKIISAKDRLVNADQMGTLFKTLAICSANITPSGF